MKTLLNKMLVVFVSFLLVLTMVPANMVRADEPIENNNEETNETVVIDDQESEIVSNDSEDLPTDTQIEEEVPEEFSISYGPVIKVNPEYKDIFDEDSLFGNDNTQNSINNSTSKPANTESGSINIYSDIESAAGYIAERMRAHNSVVEFKYNEVTNNPNGNPDLLDDLYNEAMSRVDDYVAHSALGCEFGYSATGTHYGNQYSFTYDITFNFAFSNTLEQELQFNRVLKQVLDELNLYGASDYEKIKGVYDYITSNVVYDEEAISDTHDENDKTPWSAWKALVHGEAVCQGYSLLTYKMLDTLGVEVYYAHGIANGGGPGPGAHAWNVVKLQGKYYLLDSTWDAEYYRVFETYNYFLRGTNNFYTDHNPDYDDRYVVSSTDYVYVAPTDPDVHVTGIELSPSEKTLYVGDTVQLVSTISPSNATNKKVTYNSSDNTIATVDSFGVVEALRHGVVTITATTSDGPYSDTSIITVNRRQSDFIPVTRITTDSLNYTVDVADTEKQKINVSIEPTNATIKDLDFVVDDETVATVDSDGTITPLKAGTTRVSITPVSNSYTDTPVSRLNVNIIVTDENRYVVTLHSNDGVIRYQNENYEERQFTVVKGSRKWNYDYSVISNDENKGFFAWYEDEGLTVKYRGSNGSGENSCILEEYFDRDTDLYAKYNDYITITLDFNGGYYDDYGIEETIKTYRIISETSTHPYISTDRIKNNEDLAFAGWEDSEGNLVELNNYAPSESTTLTARWTEYNTITLIVNENGYYGSHDNKIETIKVAKGSRVNGFHNPSLINYNDYIFDGFYYDQEYTNRFGSDVTLYEYKPKSDITLYARVTRNIKLTLDGNGGVIYNEYPTYTRTMPEGSSINENNLQKPTNNGTKAFAGWATSKDATQVEDISKIVLDKDTTLYAVWVSGIKVILNAQTGSFGDGSQSRTYYLAPGKTINNSYNNQYNPYKKNAEFVGWYTRPACLDSQYFVNYVYSNVFTEDTTLYAKFVDTVDFVFDANGGYFSYPTNTRNTQHFVKNEHFNSYITKPEKNDMIFAGWYDNPECIGDEETFVDYYVTEPKTYYAKWEKAYKVTFHGNGGYRTNDGSDTYVLKYKYNDLTTGGLYNYLFTRDNYLFDGYYYDSECTQKVPSVEYMRVSSDIDVYAGWTDNVSVLTFDLNGGSISYIADKIVIKNGEKADVNYLPVNENYAFEGWISGRTGNLITDLANYIPQGDEVLTASWTSDYYIISLHSENASFSIGGNAYNDYDLKVAKGSTVDIYTYSDSYSFEGWYKDATFRNKYRDSLIGFKPDKSIVLYAKNVYSQEYKITIKLNGGYYLNGSRKIYTDYVTTTYNNGNFSAPNIYYKDSTRAFSGISTTSTGSLISEPYKVTKDTTFYARYDSNIYNIKIDFNGGYSNYKSSVNVPVVKGKQLSFSEAITHPKNYQLEGYTTVKDDYSTLVTKYFWNYIPDKSMTLYAYWGSNYNCVSFVAPNGRLSNYTPASVNVLHGSFYSLDWHYAIIDDGNLEFVGWYDNPEFNGQPYTGTFKVDRDITLYAKFSDSCAVTFDANGRMFADGTTSKTIHVSPYTSLISITDMIPDTSNPDYEFVSWNTDRFGNGITYNANNWNNWIEKDLILYAQWAEEIVPITSIKITGNPKRMKVGGTVALDTYIIPNNATYSSWDNITWSSSDSSVLFVDGTGRIFGQKEGVATIFAKTVYEGVEDSVQIIVDPDDGIVRPKEINITDNISSCLYVGETAQLGYTLQPYNAQSDIIWSVNDNTIAEIDNNGVITGINEGFVNVTASTADGLISNTREFRVLKRNDEIPTQVYIDWNGRIQGLMFAQTIYVTKGQDVLVWASDGKDAIDNDEVIWKVEDPSIAQINSNGKLTGLEIGETTLYLYSKNSKDYTGQTVKVIDDNDIDVENFRYNDYYHYTRVQKTGETKRYIITFEPFVASDSNKVIRFDQEYAEQNGLDIKVTYENKYNILNGKIDKFAYVDVTGSIPGIYYVGYTVGKFFSGHFYLKVIDEDSIISVTFDSRGGLVTNPRYHYHPDADYAKEAVTFNYGDGDIARVYDAIHPNNYAFMGWYTDINDESTRIDNQYEINDYLIQNIRNSVTFYAKWDDAYSSTFDANGGSIALELEAGTKDSYIVKTPKGEKYDYQEKYRFDNLNMSVFREGYVFTGWYLDKECSKYYAGGSEKYHPLDYRPLKETVPSDNGTYYAGWSKTHKLVLQPNEGTISGGFGSDKYMLVVGVNESIDLNFYEPTLDGKVFDGWYYDKALTRRVQKPYEFKINTDTMLYAKYVDEYNVVTFDLGSGSSYIDQYNNGSQISIKVAKNRPVGAFPGTITYQDNSISHNGKWYLDSALTNEVDLNTYIPEDNVTLFAGYRNMITVTFNLNGGYYTVNGSNLTEYDYYVESGSKVTFPYNAKNNSNMAFGGWYKESGLINKVDFNTYRPTENVTLYARWDLQKVTVTLDGNGGLFENSVQSKNVDVILNSTFAEMIKPTTVVIPDGLPNTIDTQQNVVSIINWAFDSEGNDIVDDDYVFTSPVTLYAITKKFVPVMSVGIIDAPIHISFGETYQLIAEVVPENATNKKVIWSVDDSNIATVTSTGILIPKNHGTVNVTVTTESGNYSDTVAINIIDNSIRVNSIELETNNLNISVNEKATNRATVLPENATDKSLIWTSLNPQVASVDENGTVTGVSVGKTTINVSSIDERVTANFTVNVYDSYIAIQSVSFNEKNITIGKGSSQQLTYNVTPENATNKNVTWSTSDSSVALVDQSGNVTGVGKGSAYIFAFAIGTEDGSIIGDFCIVNVNENNVLEVSINEAEKTLIVGDTYELIATILPENATNKDITWSSTNESVATVDNNGVVTALEEGTTTITAVSNDTGVFDECEITVVKKTVIAESLSLNEKEIVMTIPQSKQLVATILPEDVTEKNLEWTSSDENIATVDNEGNVTAVSVGSATITAKTLDGSELVATCAVVVQEASEDVRIEFTESEIYVNIGEIKNINKPIISPTEYSSYDIEYDLEDCNEFISVEETDVLKITGNKVTEGTVAIIKARIKDFDTSGIEKRLDDAKDLLANARENTVNAKSALDAKEADKIEAETLYKNAQNNTISKQDDLAIANSNLKTAEAERSAAEKDIIVKEAALEEANNKLAEIREKSGDDALIIEEAETAKNEAKERYDAAKEQIAKGTLGFFESNGSEIAAMIINDRLENQSKDQWGKTELGKKGDATSLDSMKESIRLLKVGNNLRDKDDNFTNASPLLINDSLMAAAEVQANASAGIIGHSNLYMPCENLAWGHNDPYAGWYTAEKKVYNYAIANNISGEQAAKILRNNGQVTLNVPGYGHYTNLVNPEYTHTGFGTVRKSNAAYGVAHGQTFWYFSLDDKEYTVDEYEKLFNKYCEDVNKELADSKKNYEDAVKNYENIIKNGGIDSATQAMLNNAENNVVEATTALENARTSLTNAAANVVDKQEAVSNANSALIQAQSEKAQALENKNTVFAQYDIMLEEFNRVKEAEAVAQAEYDKANENLRGLVTICEVHVVKPVDSVSLMINETTPLEEIQVEQGNTHFINKHVVINPSDATVKDLKWTSTDETVVTIDEKGVITGVNTGTTTVTGTTIDGSNKSVTCTVRVIPAGAYGTILPQDRPSAPELIPEGLWVTGVVENVVYDPTIKSYVQSFRVYDHNVLLTEGTDYTVSYTNNKKVGEATITVKGKGNYTGTLVKTFNIVKHNLNNRDVIVVLNNKRFDETGKPQKASVSSVEYKGVKLKNKSDYKVHYENEKSTLKGTYGITIELLGNYHGFLNETYEIVEQNSDYILMSKSTVSGIKNYPYSYDVDKLGIVTPKEIVQNLVVKNGKNTLEEGIDFDVRYINNVNVGTAYVIIEGKDNYIGTITKTFKITPLALSNKNVLVSGLPDSVDYCDDPITPSATLRYNDELNLIEGQDYTVSYKNNNKAGTATITYKGIGNFSGTFNKTFKINKLNLADDMFSIGTQYEYVKGGVKPIVQSKLVLNKDYTVAYKNNTKITEQNKGVKATITIKGKGNYQGTVVKEFTIISQDISKVKINAPDKVYTGKANTWKTTVTLVDADGKKLVAGTDYNKNIKYTYENTTVVKDGTYKDKPEVVRQRNSEVQKNDILPVGTIIRVTVNTGELKVNNYSGSVSETYRIVAGDVSKATVKINSQVYTGKEVELTYNDIIVKVGTQKLDGGKDYKIVSYNNNINKGSATVVLEGIGDYGGSKAFKFSIVQKNICQIIRFHSNTPKNWTVSGTMKDQYIFKNSKLSNNTYKCKDENGVTKVFLGWSTDKNATVPEYNKENNFMFTYSFFRAGLRTNLYAVWSK